MTVSINPYISFCLKIKIKIQELVGIATASLWYNYGIKTWFLTLVFCISYIGGIARKL